jgi:hypothetical protein
MRGIITTQETKRKVLWGKLVGHILKQSNDEEHGNEGTGTEAFQDMASPHSRKQ